ncbi:hypothetical protein ACIA8K_32025 [Catenuloplanes sp. NPDC051500]|uniref:hypothetical protein n=1 Tax=Catenuloplanes sp. NPDC051500 TaxID=3363959 RepID=UPI0037A6C9D3
MRAFDEVHAALAAPTPDAASALAALTRLPQARAELDAAEAALIEAARDDGAGWSAIATALGLSSRQAGEQRLARLRRRAPRQQVVDKSVALSDAVSALSAAVADDPQWDGRTPRAALARQCLEIAASLNPDDPPGGLYSLVNDVLSDLAEVPRAALPQAQRLALAAMESAVRETGIDSDRRSSQS